MSTDKYFRNLRIKYQVFYALSILLLIASLIFFIAGLVAVQYGLTIMLILESSCIVSWLISIYFIGRYADTKHEHYTNLSVIAQMWLRK